MGDTACEPLPPGCPPHLSLCHLLGAAVDHPQYVLPHLTCSCGDKQRSCWHSCLAQSGSPPCSPHCCYCHLRYCIPGPNYLFILLFHVAREAMVFIACWGVSAKHHVLKGGKLLSVVHASTSDGSLIRLCHRIGVPPCLWGVFTQQTRRQTCQERCVHPQESLLLVWMRGMPTMISLT